MPKKYTPRKKTYRKRKTSNTKQLINRQIKSTMLRNAEHKCVWLELNETALDTLTQFYAYDPLIISQDSSARGRVGNDIKVSAIHTKLVMHNNSTNTVYLRVCLVKTYDEANLTVASYIFDTNVGGQQAPTSVTGLNQIYTPLDKSRLKTIWSRIIKLAPSTSTEGKEVQSFNKFAKLGNVKIEFQANTTGSYNVKPRYHLLFMLADANDDTGIGSTVEVSGIMRTYYTDM